ncbi:MAG: hypothetical protein IPI49_06165 [Myxococcales bacterium]|nr:hypothetical protein [Myxococcales bacterium]
MSSQSSLRAWRGHLSVACLAALWLAGCAEDAEAPPPPDPKLCQESTLSYQNFAAPFVITWCRGCHGKDQPVAMRQNAPVGVDFDTAEQVRAGSARILLRATGAAPTMPPAGGPSEQERELLAEWIACGMK